MKSQRILNNVLTQVGLQLTELRENSGYDTLKEFVQKNGLAEVQYWRIEKGKANVTLKTLVKILAIHKVSLQEFFCMLHSDRSKVKLEGDIKSIRTR